MLQKQIIENIIKEEPSSIFSLHIYGLLCFGI